jgi:hypothetical protein
MKPDSSETAALRAIGRRALAFSIPFLAIVTTISLVRGANPDIPIPGAAFWVSLAGGGIAALAISAVSNSAHGSETARHRGLAVVLFAAWVIDAISGSGTIVERFTPNLALLITEVSLLAQWIASLDVERAFAARETLERATRGLSGTALVAAVKEESLLVSESHAALSRLALYSAFFASLFAFIATVGFLGGRAVSPVSVAMVGLFTVISAFTFVLSLFHTNGVELASMGMPASPSREGKRLFAALAILVVAGLFAFILARDTPLAPTDFLARSIARAFHRPGKAILIAVPESARSGPETDPLAIARLLAEKESAAPWWLSVAYAAGRMIARAVAAAGIVWLVFGPILGIRPKDFLSAIKSLGRIARLFSAGARLILRAFLGIGAHRLCALPSKAKDAKIATHGDVIKERKTRQRKKEIDRIKAGFSRVVEWGEERGIKCDPSSGPQEYANALASAFPSLAPDLRAAATILEKSLYSARELPSKDKETFTESIRVIIAYREQSTDPAPSKTSV